MSRTFYDPEEPKAPTRGKTIAANWDVAALVVAAIAMLIGFKDTGDTHDYRAFTVAGIVTVLLMGVVQARRRRRR